MSSEKKGLRPSGQRSKNSTIATQKPVPKNIPQCPDCGSWLKLKWTDKFGGNWFWGCPTWPQCNCTHGAHQVTGEPMGMPADQETKQWRIILHKYFDQLWMRPPEGVRYFHRHGAYRWLSKKMGLDQAHIGEFDKELCMRATEVCRSKLAQVKHAGRFPQLEKERCRGKSVDSNQSPNQGAIHDE